MKTIKATVVAVILIAVALMLRTAVPKSATYLHCVSDLVIMVPSDCHEHSTQ